jgi:GR25 family glycosyltransferase involved in LPS biosynthesis/tetratricopeptide (TPR) repeat protein
MNNTEFYSNIADVMHKIKKYQADNLLHVANDVARYFSTIYPDCVELLLELGRINFAMKRYCEAYDYFEKALSFRNITKELSNTAITEQNRCIPFVANRYTYYNKDKVIEITNNRKPINPVVTFTITTCKRYNLFEQTINSFINCCSDVHRIDKWFCVDDNSSEEDREKMKTLYPFFEFYFKNEKEKGHAKSMNIIRTKVTSPFILHMEDDWKFFCKKDYVSHALDVLIQHPKISQCLFNRNYAETADNINTKGGLPAICPSGRRYIIHEYTKTEEAKRKFAEKYGNCTNCAYWPHYSFRPSILKSSVWKDVGEFNENIGHFEMDYSNRCTQKGYTSTFFDSIYSLHIGRLTSERHDNSKLNAYLLNGVNQFGPPSETQSSETQSSETQSSETQSSETQSSETQSSETQSSETQSSETQHDDLINDWNIAFPTAESLITAYVFMKDLLPKGVALEIIKARKLHLNSATDISTYIDKLKEKIITTDNENANKLIAKLTSILDSMTSDEIINYIKNGTNARKIMKTFVINLDRRPDRWENFSKQSEPKFLKYNRFSAVDGSTLVPTEQLQRIFDGNDYNMRKGMVGCALSHIKLYTEILTSNIDIACIFEDDITFVPNFEKKFLHLFKDMDKDWDLCYLGHHVWPAKKTETMYDKESMPVVQRLNTQESLTLSMGGTGGYLITRQGVEKLLSFINKNGMVNGIDTMQQRCADFIKVYYCTPHLIYSECWLGDNNPDTDIQHDFSSLTIPIEQRYQKIKKQYDTIGQTVVLTDLNEVTQYITDCNNTRVAFYRGTGIKELATQCVHPCFTIANDILVIVPGTGPFHRLIKNGIYDISDVTEFTKPCLNEPDCVIIPYGDLFSTEIIKNIVSQNTEYPFDTIDGGTFTVFAYLTEMVLKMTDEELDEFLRDMFADVNGQVLTQSWNVNKNVYKSIKYNISFPEENINYLHSIYFGRFKNLITAIKSNKPIKIVHATRWTKTSPKMFNHFMEVVKSYNENVTMLTINGLGNNETTSMKSVISTYIDYPEKYRNDNWPYDKKQYDTIVFKDCVSKAISTFYSQSKNI